MTASVGDADLRPIHLSRQQNYLRFEFSWQSGLVLTLTLPDWAVRINPDSHIKLGRKF